MSTTPPGTWRRFASALLALAGVVVAIPSFLVACSRAAFGATSPVPGVGSAAEIRTWFERELSTTEIVPIVLRALLIVGWVLWALLVLSVVAAIARSRPSVGHVRIPHLAMFDGIAVWIAAGLTVLSSLAPRVAIASPNVESVFAPIHQLEPAVAGPSYVAAPARVGFERVETGESIEMFAERTLGDGNRWPEIWDLGQGEIADAASGARWTEPWRIEGGWQLRMPQRIVPASSTVAVVAPSDPTSASGADHLVEAGDSYWSIASGELSVRLGRAPTDTETAAFVDLLIEHNAPRLGHDEPAMIHPGDRVATDVAFEADAVEPGVRVVVAGESYWSIAKDELTADLDGPPTTTEIAEFSTALIARNAPRLGYDDPAMIHPGDRLVTTDDEAAPAPAPSVQPSSEVIDVAEPDLSTNVTPPSDQVRTGSRPVTDGAENLDLGEAADPVVAAPELATAPPWNAPTEVTATPAPPATRPGAGPINGTSVQAAGNSSPRQVGVLTGLSVLSAAGLAGVIRMRRRRADQQIRPRQRRAPLSPASEAALEDVFYRDISDVTWMDLELRLLAHQLDRSAREVMTIQLVQLGNGRTMEVAFVEIPPVPPPDGWQSAADRVWRLDGPHDESTLNTVTDAPPVAPCLVTIGGGDDGGQLYLNAEAAHGIFVSGDPQAVNRWVTNAAFEIAAAAVGEHPTVKLVSAEPSPALCFLDGVEGVTEQDAIEELAEVFEDGPVGVSGSMLSRRTGKWETWPATTIVLSEPSHDDRWPLLAAAPWVTVFSTAQEFGDGLTINIDDGVIGIDSLGITARAAGMTDADNDAIAGVLEDLDAEPIADDDAFPVPDADTPLEIEVTDEDWEAPLWPVMINVLGTPTAARNGEPLKLTPQQLSALALIAIKREIPAHDFKRAIWGDEDDVTPERVRDMLSELRKKVGGLRVIPKREDGLVTAGADLGCDTLIFDAIASRAREAPDELIDRLHQMLDLVTGRPFNYASADQTWWRWSELAFGMPDWISRASTAAGALALRYLEMSKPRNAIDIAERGLTSDPHSVTLTEVLITAYGDLAMPEAARRTYESHDRSLNVAALGEASEQTRDLIASPGLSPRQNLGEAVAAGSALPARD